MSQKAICPRGHIWDPSTLAGLPPSERPRCPICGEEEPLRASNALGRLTRWCRNNPLLTAMSCLCLLLAVVVLVTLVQSRGEADAARREIDKIQFEAEQTTAKLRSRLRAAETQDREEELKRQAEVQAEQWRNREKEFEAQVRDAKKARREALLQRDDQIKQRRLAEELTQTANQVREEALRTRAETTRQLVKMHVAAGTRLMEDGELAPSLLWYAEALRLAEKEKLPAQAHRLRLAVVLSQCPRPVQMWIHDRKITVVQLSPDGKQILTGGANGAVELLDAATGKRLGEPLAHAEAITHAQFSPDGKQALTAAADMTLHLWDLAKGQEVFTAQQLMGPIAALAFSADGKRFLVVTDKAPMGAAEVQLHVHDAASGEAAGEAALGSEISPRPAVFSPDGQRILTVCQDRCARIWDIATGKQVGPSFIHAATVIHASFSPDGQRVLTASADGMARVWKTRTGEPATVFLKHGTALRGAAFSPSGPFVLTFGEDRSVRVWDANRGEVVGPALRHNEAVNDALFSPDGRYVLTTSAEGAVRMWDYRTGDEVVPALHHGEAIRSASLTPGGDGVLTLAGQVVRLWDLTTPAVGLADKEGPAARRSEPADLEVFSPDGKRVLRVTETAVRVYDTKTNEPVGATLPHKNKVTAAMFSADGRRLLTVSHQPNGDEQEGHVRVWETASGELIGQPLVHPRSVLEASFSPDGRRLLTACQDGKARLWDVDKSLRIGEPMEQKTDVSRALFVPDGKRILTVDVEGGLRLWDALNAEAVGPIWGHQKPVHDLAFSPDGQKLVTASDDGTARVWEASGGKEIASTPVQGASVLRAGFSPDGKRIVTVSGDQRARIWDAGSGKALSPAMRHRAAISFVSFSPDGKRLVTDAADGLRVWDATSGEPISPLVRHRSETPRQGGGRTVRDPLVYWGLSFAAEERPAADLKRVAEVFTGQRIADAGEPVPLEHAELSKAWQDVQKKSTRELPSAGERAAWHRRGAAECRRRQLWSGALQHLDFLIVAGASPDLYGQRGQANVELQRWEAAKADYTKALTGGDNRWDLWAGRARAEDALGRWQEAAADYSKAIERRSDRAELWTARGRIEAEHGDWRKAAADLGKAVHLGERDAIVWRQHILALGAAGDEANYRRACGRVLQHFGDSKDDAVFASVVQACSLSDAAVRDWKPLIERLRQSLAANPKSPEARRQLALLLYRAGQFDAALQQMQDGMKVVPPEPQERDWLVMAMAAKRLGRGEDAKKWLDKAGQLRRDRARDDRQSWEDRLLDDTLHREAQQLMKDGKG